MQMKVDELGHGSVALVYRNSDRGKLGSYWVCRLVGAGCLRFLQQAAGLGDELGNLEGLY
jgi:hypothetical protein